jgi:hypothetical protein
MKSPELIGLSCKIVHCYLKFIIRRYTDMHGYRTHRKGSKSEIPKMEIIGIQHGPFNTISENVKFCLLIWAVMFIVFENVPTFSGSNSGIVLAHPGSVIDQSVCCNYKLL